MKPFYLACWHCGETYEAAPIYACLKCKGSLEVRYPTGEIATGKDFEKLIGSPDKDIWKFRSMLPILPGAAPITLGEGGTPLLRTNNIQNIVNIENIYLKLESMNPTLAFKDRPLAVALTVAVQFGMTEVICASTGNTGVAAAAYSARAGLQCTIFVPEGTPQEKLAAMAQYGARLKTVKGNYSDAYHIAEQTAVQNNAFNLTSTYMNPYAVEGNKTVGYEIAGQLGGAPDWIIVPIGAGPLLSGIYKGFNEMLRAGFINKLPRMVGVQAEGCAPIVQAYRNGDTEVQAWRGSARTIASGIADPLLSYPADGSRTLAVIRESGGTAAAVSDDELIRYRKLLAEREGVLAELSSVTAIAAIEQLRKTDIIGQADKVVSIVTGHGLKDLSATINKE